MRAAAPPAPMSVDFKNCCRVCLDVGPEHHSILLEPSISLHIKSCLNIVVLPTDQLPKGVCSSCVKQLREFYSFLLNARCSQDWLEANITEFCKKPLETKVTIQPLPDSEYNSDSLLEFLNSTSNIEEYLNNLGKDDIPTIAGILDRHDENNDNKIKKQKEGNKLKSSKGSMEIDVLDSDIDVVKDILLKEIDSDKKGEKQDKNRFCFACKARFNSTSSLSQHLSICDAAVRTCICCEIMFDSKKKMLQHYITHTTYPYTCVCGDQFETKDILILHANKCHLHVESKRYIYKCKQCSKTFKDRLQLYHHVKLHLKKAAEVTCDICSHKFTGQELSKHKKDVHKIAQNYKYKCKVCSFTSEDHRHIYIHVKRHLLQERHLCETCGCSFATLATLNKHTKTHTKKDYVCKICYKTFDCDSAWKTHIQEHDQIMCEKCGETVSLASHQC